jgi:hypothetical protein
MTKSARLSQTQQRLRSVVSAVLFAFLSYHLFWMAIDSGSYWHYGLLIACIFVIMRNLVWIVRSYATKNTKA